MGEMKVQMETFQEPVSDLDRRLLICSTKDI